MPARDRIVVAAALGAICLAVITTPALTAPSAPRGWRAYPNPFSTRFRVELPDSIGNFPPYPEMQIRVFDAKGHLIRHWTYVAYSGLVIEWDARTDQGVVAPTGFYIFDIRFKNFPPAAGVRFKMLHIRGSLNHIYNWNWR